ncbi:MAG TPA: GxxExxY protein [Candidatus Methylacidiphilales bacterium]|jgi:GxxExxY protein|nr:GxxExxY protein [Candidatus Methylacidiphilales bacterium]
MKDMSGDPDTYLGENDSLTGAIIGCAITIHKVLGPGFLENIYHKALAHELAKARIEYVSEARLQVLYDGIVLGDYIADFVVHQRVVVELKAVDQIIKAHEIQLVNYLTAIRFDVGLLINFGGQKIQVRRKFRELNRAGSA